MRLKGILITAIVLLSAAFAAVNWQALLVVQPTNLLFGTFEIPLGMTLLFIAVGLSLVFFLVSLFDRAAQYGLIARQEAHINRLQAKLDKRRLEEIAELAAAVETSLATVGQQVREENARLEVSLREDLSSFETRTRDRMDDLEDSLQAATHRLADTGSPGAGALPAGDNDGERA